MKKIRNICLGIIALITIAVIFNSCKVGRFFYYNFADIKDYKIFPSRPLSNDSVKFTFVVSGKEKIPKTIRAGKEEAPFNEFLKSGKTVALLVIQNDTVKYENYFRGYDESSIVPSFSMAKSITSILIGCAIDDGLIKSVDEPVTNYIPELKKNGFEKITIKHLLQMTSGIKFKESYISPFGDAATFYYGTRLRKSIGRMKTGTEPGKEFQYVSGNSELLGMVLERALKNKTNTQYLQEKLWKPLGMEYDASWSIDRKKNGIEKTFCCINARARDYAKIGRLYLKKGNWNGKQIVSESWVKQSTSLDVSEGSPWFYQYQWWIPSKDGAFLAQGILGQYIYVNPAKNLIIVRLGKKQAGYRWWDFFNEMAKYY